jgi:hypothetical protein
MDERDRDWTGKLSKYARLGVRELVRFDPADGQQPLRIWDNIDQDLVERALSSPCAQSHVLHGFWLAVEDPEIGPTLRLSHDAEGNKLYPSKSDRIRELEAELARVGR